MKQLLVSISVSIFVAIAVFGFLFVDAANAVPVLDRGNLSLRTPSPYLADAQPEADFITQLKAEILPKLEQIFTTEQQEQFQTKIAEGASFRKAFKAMMLTPEQKMQLKTLLQSTLKKDALATLTPEQKKQIFSTKKGMFKPDAEEITQRIEASLKEKGVALPAGIKEKIDAGLKQKDSFFNSEAIVEKIEAGIDAIKDRIDD